MVQVPVMPHDQRQSYRSIATSPAVYAAELMMYRTFTSDYSAYGEQRRQAWSKNDHPAGMLLKLVKAIKLPKMARVVSAESEAKGCCVGLTVNASRRPFIASRSLKTDALVKGVQRQLAAEHPRSDSHLYRSRKTRAQCCIRIDKM